MPMFNTNFCYPDETTWYIAFEVEARVYPKSYNYIETDQCLTTPWEVVDYYTDEVEWLVVLAQYGIEPNEE